jgi:branched-chain amino acid transport system substrate-binding protein
MEWSDIFNRKLPAKGYKTIDPGRFPYGLQDYTAIINKFKKEKVDILAGTIIPPDWITGWRQCHQQGFLPKIATIGKALLLPAEVYALGGNLPHGLTTEVQWSPAFPFKSSLTGETPKELCAAWTKETGKQWTQPIGGIHATLERAIDALTRAQSLDKVKIRDAIAATDLHTITGYVKYNKQHYIETPLVGGQWVKGKDWKWDMEIVYNKQHPEIPTTRKMIFPLPR